MTPVIQNINYSNSYPSGTPREHVGNIVTLLVMQLTMCGTSLSCGSSQSWSSHFAAMATSCCSTASASLRCLSSMDCTVSALQSKSPARGSILFRPPARNLASPIVLAARGPSWHRDRRLVCVTQARRTWQVRAKPQRQKEDDEDDIFFPEAEEIDREALQAFLDLQLQTDYDLDDARHYEIMFLVPENKVEMVPEVIKKVEAFVAEQKGRIWRVNDWGLRRLAYKIKKADRANYVLMNIEMKAAAINQLNTMFEKDERVIRHMCISQKEAHVEDTVPPPNYYSESANGAEGDDEDDASDVDDDDDEDDEEDDEEDEASASGSSQESKEWTQIVQEQESSAAL